MVPVLTVSQPVLDESTPLVRSLAFALAVAFPLSTTGLGETVGFSVGLVASYLNAAEAAAADAFPALSVHLPETVRLVPSGPL